jgi:hypothetical protein
MRLRSAGCEAFIIGLEGVARRTGESVRGGGNSSTPVSACVGCRTSDGSLL